MASYQSNVSAIKLSSRRIADLSLERTTIEQSLEEFRKRISAENPQILEEKRTRVGGEGAYEIRLARAPNGEHEIVLITLFRNREYTFSLSAPNEQELNAKAPDFEAIIARLRWHRPERVYRSNDDALTLDVPLQWTVSETYKDKDRFVLIGPIDRGIANSVAVSRWDRNGRSLVEFVSQYLRDSENVTNMQSWEINDKGKRTRYLIFARIGEPPATRRPRRLFDRDAYVLEFSLNRFNVGGYDTSPRSLSSPQISDERNVRVMQTFILVGDYIYIFNFCSFDE